jgi:hypothetical protein
MMGIATESTEELQARRKEDIDGQPGNGCRSRRKSAKGRKSLSG